jgi:hypothetical protein
MATLREYFDTDFTTLLKNSIEVPWQLNHEHGVLSVRVHLDFDSNVKFLSVFLPAGSCHGDVIKAALLDVHSWLTAGDGLEVRLSREGEAERRSTDLRFAGRVFLYHEAEIATDTLAEIARLAGEDGLALHFRGPRFATGRVKYERPLAFISHDSRDKAEIARPLAVALSIKQCPVWFDEFSLRSAIDSENRSNAGCAKRRNVS